MKKRGKKPTAEKTYEPDDNNKPAQEPWWNQTAECTMPNGDPLEIYDSQPPEKASAPALVICIILTAVFVTNVLIGITDNSGDLASILAGILNSAIILVLAFLVYACGKIRTGARAAVLSAYTASALTLFSFTPVLLMELAESLGIAYQEYYQAAICLLVMVALALGLPSILRAENRRAYLVSRIIIIAVSAILAVGSACTYAGIAGSAGIALGLPAIRALLLIMLFSLIAAYLVAFRSTLILKPGDMDRRNRIFCSSSHRGIPLVNAAGFMMMTGALTLIVINVMGLLFGTDGTIYGIECSKLQNATLIPSVAAVAGSLIVMMTGSGAGHTAHTVKGLPFLLVPLSLYSIFSMDYMTAADAVNDSLFSIIPTTFNTYLANLLPDIPAELWSKLGAAMGVVLAVSVLILRLSKKSMRVVSIIPLICLALILFHPLALSTAFTSDAEGSFLAAPYYMLILSGFLLAAAVITKCDHRLLVAEAHLATGTDASADEEPKDDSPEEITENDEPVETSDEAPQTRFCPMCGRQYDPLNVPDRCPDCNFALGNWNPENSEAEDDGASDESGEMQELTVRIPYRLIRTKNGYGGLELVIDGESYPCDLGEVLRVSLPLKPHLIRFIQKDRLNEELNIVAESNMDTENRTEIHIEYDVDAKEYVFHSEEETDSE